MYAGPLTSAHRAERTLADAIGAEAAWGGVAARLAIKTASGVIRIVLVLPSCHGALRLRLG
jgi:hypothetical protein